MDFKSQLGPDALTITYPHTADGRKPGRPNFLTLMAALNKKLDKTHDKLNRLQWSVVGLVILELILRWI